MLTQCIVSFALIEGNNNEISEFEFLIWGLGTQVRLLERGENSQYL